MTRRFNGGKAAENGVMAALLAEMGFTSAEESLGGRFGFYGVFANGEYDLEVLTQGLGTSYEIMNAWFKAYPMNATLHAPVEALLCILDQHRIRPGEVEEVASCWQELNPILAKKEAPATAVSAQFSLPYALAAALVRGKLSAEEFTDEAIRDPEVLAVMQRVTTRHDPELTQRTKLASSPGKVTLRLKDGREYTEEVLYPKGHPANPMTDEESGRKFFSLASSILPRGQCDKVYELVMGLEEVGDLSALVQLLAPAKR
jgi:2-methylcitrate dehydratase PrpD